MSERKNPILLRRGPISGRVEVITRYTEKDGVVRAQTKHDVSDDFRALMLLTLMPPGCADLQPIMVRAAKGEELSEAEAESLGDFADRLGAEILANNEALEA